MWKFLFLMLISPMAFAVNSANVVYSYPQLQQLIKQEPDVNIRMLLTKMLTDCPQKKWVSCQMARYDLYRNYIGSIHSNSNIMEDDGDTVLIIKSNNPNTTTVLYDINSAMQTPAFYSDYLGLIPDPEDESIVISFFSDPQFLSADSVVPVSMALQQYQEKWNLRKNITAPFELSRMEYLRRIGFYFLVKKKHKKEVEEVLLLLKPMLKTESDFIVYDGFLSAYKQLYPF